MPPSKGQRTYRLGHKQFTTSVFALLLIIASQLHRLFLQLSYPLPFVTRRGGFQLFASHSNSVRKSYLSTSCCMPNQPQPPRLHYSNNRLILQRVTHYIIPHYESFSILLILQLSQFLKPCPQHTLTQFSLKARE